MLDDDDRQHLAYLLMQLGYGVPLTKIFKIPRGRPLSIEHEEMAYEIAIAILPVAKGGQGLKVDKAKRQVAAQHNKSLDAVEKAWKSKSGKVIKRAVRRNAPRGYEIGPI